jgi:predicted nucleotidyltransferase
MTATITVSDQELSEFCRNNSIRRLSVFGSVLTERFSDSSDVDVLVESCVRRQFNM